MRLVVSLCLGALLTGVVCPRFAFAQTPPIAPAHSAVVERPEPPRSSFQAGPITVEVIDYSPQFLAWYAAAKTAPDAETRFALWEQLYGQASVPPNAEGRAIARAIVQGAWPRYEQAIPIAEKGAAGLQIDAVGFLTRAAALLKLETPSRMQMKTIIGSFDTITSAGRGDLPSMTLPLEAQGQLSDVMLAHEFGHCVHMLVNPDAGHWQNSVGMAMLTEGLGMHIARTLQPGKADVEYVSGLRNLDRWTKQVANRQSILAAVRKDLAAKDDATRMKYRTGEGVAGTRNELYAAGWWVVEQLQSDGMSLADIARITSRDAEAVADRAIGALLAASVKP